MRLPETCRQGSAKMRKAGRDIAQGPVRRQEGSFKGPRTTLRVLYLDQPGSPPEAKRRLVPRRSHLQPQIRRYVSSETRDASLDNARKRYHRGDVLSLSVANDRRVVSRSCRCFGRQFGGNPVQVSWLRGCPHMCQCIEPHVSSIEAALGGCPAVWSISHRSVYCSR